MQSIFLLDAVIPGGTKSQYLQTCSEPVYLPPFFLITTGIRLAGIIP